MCVCVYDRSRTSFEISMFNKNETIKKFSNCVINVASLGYQPLDSSQRSLRFGTKEHETCSCLFVVVYCVNKLRFISLKSSLGNGRRRVVLMLHCNFGVLYQNFEKNLY